MLCSQMEAARFSDTLAPIDRATVGHTPEYSASAPSNPTGEVTFFLSSEIHNEMDPWLRYSSVSQASVVTEHFLTQ